VNQPIPPAVQRARLQLMLNEPFLASAVARYPLVVADEYGWCQTCATDGYFIYINREFCGGLSEPHMSFVLAHEVAHCLLGHIDRRGSRHAEIWNQAIDHATNLLLIEAGMDAPPDGLYDRHFRGMTAEEIYDVLCEDPAHQKSGGNSTWADLHLPPDAAEGASARSLDFPTSEERQRLRRELLTAAAGSLPGTVAGLYSAEFAASGQKEVPWPQLLARFMSGLRRSDFRTYPFHRKHLWRGMYLPSLGLPGPEHLVLAIDTSGSISDDLLKRFLSALHDLRVQTECALSVIQFDATLQDVRRFEAFEPLPETYRMRGRGGTDIRAPFDWYTAQNQREGMTADAIVVLTDGYGPCPSTAPAIPVLWILTKDGVKDVPFGAMIRLQ
jgi:predicted metal-dependent peptidase